MCSIARVLLTDAFTLHLDMLRARLDKGTLSILDSKDCMRSFHCVCAHRTAAWGALGSVPSVSSRVLAIEIVALPFAKLADAP